MSPLFRLGIAKREYITVRHTCGCVCNHPVHPKVSDVYRAEIAAGLAIQLCPSCKAQAARKETRKARGL